MASTNRLKRVGRWGLIGLATAAFLVAAYWAVWVFLAPRLVRAVLLPKASAALGAELTAAGVAIDPFRATVVVEHAALKRSGTELAAFHRLAVDIKAVESLRRQRLIFSGTLSEPVVRPEVDAKGRFNLVFPVPHERSGSPAFPFLLEKFTLNKGRIGFRDASGRTPYGLDLEGVAFELENLGSEPDRKAGFRFSAGSAQGGEISATGTFSPSALSSEGELRVAGLDLPSHADYLAPELPFRLTAGQATATAHYVLRAGDRTEFEIQGGELRIEHPVLANREGAKPWLELAGISGGNLFYDSASGKLTLASLEAGNGITPWVRVESLTASRLSYSKTGERLTAASLDAGKALTPWGGMASLSARDLDFALVGRRLAIASATVREVAAPGTGNGGSASEAEKPAARIGELKGSEIAADLTYSGLRAQSENGGVGRTPEFSNRIPR